MRRVLQRRLLDPLALAVLDGRFHEGDVVMVDNGEDGLVLNRGTDTAPAVDANRT